MSTTPLAALLEKAVHDQLLQQTTGLAEKFANPRVCESFATSGVDEGNAISGLKFAPTLDLEDQGKPLPTIVP